MQVATDGARAAAVEIGSSGGARPGGRVSRSGSLGRRAVGRGARRDARDALARYARFDETGDEFWYDVREDGCACVVRCTSRSECLRIPETLGGCAVSELASESFCNLICVRQVVCPNSLRRIGERAFAGCVRLRDLGLNEGVETIGNGAFSLCGMLGEVCLPSTVKRVGSGFATSWNRIADPDRRSARIVSGSDDVIVDASGVVYERSRSGLVLVDGSRFSDDVLTVRSGTTAIGAGALAQNAAVSRVVLPDGLVGIGENAFRGCTRLVAVDIPETLEEIGPGAFSCASVRTLYLPKRCTRLCAESLATGPVFPGSDGQPYTSTLREIRVHPENPVYFMRGQVLCRRADGLAAGSAEAVLAPCEVDEADLSREVASVLPGAFAGTVSVGCLRVSERVALPAEGPLLPHGRCGRLVIELAVPRDGRSAVDIDLPADASCARVLSAGTANGRIDVEGLLSAYDEALPSVSDAPGRLRLMAARLAAPVHLSERIAQSFAEAVRGALHAACDYFGARNDWRALDCLLDAGVLDESNISDVVGGLAARGRGLAAGYLLDAKRARFGKACFDYGI